MSMVPIKKPLLANFLGKTQVLVVEPSLNYRISLKQFLSNLHVKQVKLVGSVAEARRAMLASKIGLFIVEWDLETTNGLQFCRELHKENVHKDTPFLLMSVENLRNDVILASEVRVDAYLLKPFSYEDFCTQIGAIIKARTTTTPLTQMLSIGDQALVDGNTQQAEAAFNSALAMQEHSARAMVGLGRLSLQRGDTVRALDQLKQALAANPDFIEAYRAMLEIYTEVGDRAGILQTASALAKLSPGNPSYTLTLAKAYLDMNHLESAEDFFKKSVHLSPRLAEAYKGLGHVYVARDEYEKAMKNFKKALDLDEKDISTLNSLGLTYVHMGQHKAGIDKYLFALKLEPTNFRVLFNLGAAYEKQGERDKAHKYYSQALVHCPDYDKALRGLERLGGHREQMKAVGGGSFDFTFGEDDEDF